MEWTVTLDQLDTFAARFWTYVKEAKVFAFHGTMGAGKTTTIAALCRHKGVQEAVASPTFSIINEYGYTTEGEEKKIYHIDLYRLNDREEVLQSGVEDCLFSGAVCFVEWPEKAPHLFDEHTVHVLLLPVDAHTRTLKIATPAQFHNNSMTEQL